MPRATKAPRLWLKPAARDRKAVWIIIDRGKHHRTGCREGDIAGAERALARYITAKYEPPKNKSDIAEIRIADVVNVYLKEHAPNTRSAEFIAYTAGPILEWWGDKTLSEIKKQACAEYVRWRTAQNVVTATARHDLKTLRAAVLYYHGEHGPLASVPVVHLPERPEPRQDYFLTRKQVADRIRAARRGVRTQHVIRLLLIGIYTGTRPGTVVKLRWLPSTEGGWFDLESETLHRRATGATETKKKQTKARIHRRLLPWLRRWKKTDAAAGITHVVHYHGTPVKKVRKAWAQIAIAAGHAAKGARIPDGPHICRHTCATWMMQSGVDIHEAAGYLGMSEKTLLEVYGHHHPDFQGAAASASGKRPTAMKRQRNA